MAPLRVLVTTMTVWDAPGISSTQIRCRPETPVKSTFLLLSDPHSMPGTEVTETLLCSSPKSARQRIPLLSATPTIDVRVALTAIFEGHRLGASLAAHLALTYLTSGTVAAREKPLSLGKTRHRRSLSYIHIQRSTPLTGKPHARAGRPVIFAELVAEGLPRPKILLNVNLPPTERRYRASRYSAIGTISRWNVRFHREGDALRFSGSYQARPRTPGRDQSNLCFTALSHEPFAPVKHPSTVPPFVSAFLISRPSQPVRLRAMPANSLDLAQWPTPRYKRFWLAEHHGIRSGVQ